MSQNKRYINLNENYELEIAFPYDPELVDAMHNDFERTDYQPHRKLWLAPPTEVNLEAAKGLACWSGFQLKNIERALGVDLMKLHRERRTADSLSIRADIHVSGLGGELYPFQRAAVSYVARVRRCIIADEMGTGKTVEALATLQYVGAFPALVISPASLKFYWKQEVSHWLPTRSVAILDGQPSKLPAVDLLIVNYAVLHKYLSQLEKKRFKALVCDEAHYLKNHQAKRTKAVNMISKRIPYRLLLTGTPVLNRPQELVSPLTILGKIWKDWGGPSAFLEKYCPSNWGYYDGAANLEELNQSLREKCYLRRTKHQLLPELPPKQKSRIWFELDDYHSYSELELETVAWAQHQNDDAVWNERNHSNTNVLQRLSLLRKETARRKLSAVCAWVRDFLKSGEKLVLFAYHQEIVQAVAETFSAVSITGKTPVKKRAALVNQFQEDATMKLLVLSMGVGGAGWTLHAACNVAFAEMDWTPGAHDQAEDRLHRIGQKNAVTAWYLLAQYTVDEDMYALVERKRYVVDAATDGGTATEILQGIIKRHRDEKHE